MRKVILHISLIVVVALSQLYNTVVTAVYQLNYDYYSQELCENQDRPELHCDGKCYFSKQLALANESPEETEPPILIPSLKLFSQIDTHGSNQVPSGLNYHKPSFRFNQELLLKPYLGSIDHPPQV